MSPYKNHTLKQFYETAMREINYDVRKETALDRVRRIENHVIPHLGAIKIKSLTALKIEAWQRQTVILSGADQTRRCKYLLKAILNRAIVHGVITSNPIEAVAQIRERRENKREIYTRQELQTILSNATGQTRLFILTMISMGIRSGEAVVIKFDDIDYDSRTICIQRSMRKGEIKTTKTAQSRIIDIPLQLFNEIISYRDSICPREFIFITSNGTPYRDSTYFLRRHFKPLLEHLGIKYKTMYSLRHTYATMSLQKGQSINYVAKQLGHSDTRTTQEFYIKYLRDKDEIKRADGIFSF